MEENNLQRLKCPVCHEVLQRETLFISQNMKDVIYICNNHGVIFEIQEEINCIDNSTLLGGVRKMP